MAPSLFIPAKYYDSITGFEGVAYGHTRYMSGCSQVLLIPKVDKDGKRREGEWFDVQRLIQMPDPVAKLDNGDTPGCDKAGPLR